MRGKVYMVDSTKKIALTFSGRGKTTRQLHTIENSQELWNSQGSECLQECCKGTSQSTICCKQYGTYHTHKATPQPNTDNLQQSVDILQQTCWNKPIPGWVRMAYDSLLTKSLFQSCQHTCRKLLSTGLV